MYSREQLNAITSEVLNAAFDVHTVLGPGLLESTYERCLAYKLEKAGFSIKRQLGVLLQFEELRICDAYRIDILVNDAVVLEIKACESLADVHFAQLLSYLKAMDKRVGLLMNFNSVHLKQGIHRVVNNF